MPKIQRIALILALDVEYGRALLRGIRAYARPGKPWVFHIATPDPDVFDTLAAWNPSGIIAHISRADLVEPLRQLNKPCINVSSALDPAPMPRVGMDSNVTGKMAAEHFMERGVPHFAYMGYEPYWYVRAREKGYRAALKASGHEKVYTFYTAPPSPRGGHWAATGAELHHWVQGLPKPVGVWAAHDQHALELAEVCRLVGLRVPDDVAILGCDNDELICTLAHPPLSSIQNVGEQTAYEACAMLERWLAGRQPPDEPVLMPPSGIVVRQSSDILTISDTDLRAAVRFIRNHVDEMIGVEDILREVMISRRSLERKFKTVLGRSPLDEIRRVRVERVKELLTASDMPMPEIAARAGFSGPDRLAIVFRDETGMAPTDYRKQFRLRG
jgi:LacI family transcriptional regulator